MHIPRLYTNQTLAQGITVSISGQSAHHLLHVLRLRAGAGIQVFDGRGHEYQATIRSTERSGIVAETGEAVTNDAESRLQITLLQGIARNDRMDFILQKAVELGVSQIQPLWMKRSQNRVKGKRLEKRMAHWHSVVTSACEQCGRSILPALPAPADYPAGLASLEANSMRIMLQPGSNTSLAVQQPPAGGICLLVGPEGGLDTDEQTLARTAGFTGISLGPRILRTETAALAALAGMQTLWGDFS